MNVQHGNHNMAPTSGVMATALGFAPLQSSFGLGWTKAAMFTWRGEAGDVEYQTGRDPVIVLHTGGAPNVPFEMNNLGRDGRSRPGFVTVIPAKSDMVWHVNGGIHAYSFHLLGEFFQDFPRALRESLADSLSKYRAVCDPVILTLLKSLANELSSPTEFGGLYADSLADSVAVHILRHHDNRLTDSFSISEHSLKSVLNRIELELDSGITVQNLADDLGYARGDFAIRFRQSMGTSPHTYIVQRRISRAYTLLSESDKSLSEIAFDCGYSSQSHFTSQFKRITGNTPGAVRRHNC